MELSLVPTPTTRAIALLALRDRTKEPIVQDSVDYLERVSSTLTAPWSLAWAILALATHGRSIDSIYSSLAASPDLSNVDDTSTLALVCLALDYQRALSAFALTS